MKNHLTKQQQSHNNNEAGGDGELRVFKYKIMFSMKHHFGSIENTLKPIQVRRNNSLCTFLCYVSNLRGFFFCSFILKKL